MITSNGRALSREELLQRFNSKPKVARTKLTKIEQLKQRAIACADRVSDSLAGYNNRPRFSLEALAIAARGSWAASNLSASARKVTAMSRAR